MTDAQNHRSPPLFVVLTELELLHFRNLESQQLRFPHEGAAIVGNNAQGKTNLLEAVYYLESFRSFRGSADTELLAFGETVFRLEARLEGGQAPTVPAAFDSVQRRKKVTVDGVEAKPLSQALGQLGAVVFSPADVELVSAGPAKRRRFLNILLSLNHPGYVDALQRYRKALAQRNAALKTGVGREGVRVWDQPVASAGALVTRARSDWVGRWQDVFADFYKSVSGGGSARMSYRSKAVKEDGGPERGNDREARVMDLMEEAANGDLRLRTTTVGPHRDEVAIGVDDGSGEISARTFGSGGQRRSAALALRLVEAATIRESRKVEPLLLLDDAFAELDDKRTGHIMALIEGEGTGQVIVTAPKESDVKHFRQRLPKWTIENGVIAA
ncbi:MAG: DNA replication/repair protein RecF [Longimicrobiales bacterium]